MIRTTDTISRVAGKRDVSAFPMCEGYGGVNLSLEGFGGVKICREGFGGV